MQKLMDGWSGFMTRENARMIWEKMISVLGDDTIAVIAAAQEFGFDPVQWENLRFGHSTWFESKTGVGFAIVTEAGNFAFDVGGSCSDPEPPYFRFEDRQILVRRKICQMEENIVYLVFRRNIAQHQARAA
jgi:hypothetical protein